MNDRVKYFHMLMTISIIFAVLNFLTLLSTKDVFALCMYCFNVTMAFIFRGLRDNAKKNDKKDKTDV